MDFADMLIAELDVAGSWPIPREKDFHTKLTDRRALRLGDKPAIKRMMGWDANRAEDGGERELLLDPLPRVIARGFADFLFGEDPAITLPRGVVADRELEQLDAVNHLGASFHRAARICVAEGEVWGKVHVNRDIAAAPILEWRSRIFAVPLWYGDRVLAVAFVTERQRDAGVGDDAGETVWRHAEVHTVGRVVNVLYRGSAFELGAREALTAIPSTSEMADEWRHGLPFMLAWRVVNDLDEDDQLGEGDYDQVQDLLLAGHEAVTIASENARLTGKDRVFAAGRFTRADGSFPAGVDVFTVEQEGGVLGATDSRPPVVAIEKTYDAEPLWLHINRLTAMVLSRVGLVPQLVGQDVDGHGESGLAIRLRFLPTDNAARGKARSWDATTPAVVHALLSVGALSKPDGGFDWDYTATEPPAVTRGDILPVDGGETVRDNAVAVEARIRSRRTAIREQHPDWTDEQIDEELDRIDADDQLDRPAPGVDDVPA